MVSIVNIFLFFHLLFTLQWSLRSLALLIFSSTAITFSTIWNTSTSCILFTSALFLTLRYLRSLLQHKPLRNTLLILNGPMLLVLTITGTLLDFISYDDLICGADCSGTKKILSQVLNKLHCFWLLILSLVAIKIFASLASEEGSELTELLVRVEDARLENRNEEICAICRDFIGNEEYVVEVKRCGHLHHGGCFEKWMEVKRECPVCRAQLR